MALLLLAALLPFAAVRHYPHVHDDHVLRGVGSLVLDTRTDAASLWTADFFGTYDEPRGQTGFWRPLVLAGFALEARLAGDSWAGYVWLGHVLTLLAHAAATLALWRLLGACGLGRPGALLAATLFAVAPVHVESVAWISGRGDSLAAAAAFAGAALWIGAPAHDRRLWLRALGAGALFVAALLSKETAVLLLGLTIPVGRLRGLSWRRAALPVAGAVALYLVLRAVSFGLAREVAPEAWTGPDDAAVRWFTWLSILPDLVLLLVWPGPATPLRPVAAAEGLLSPGVLAGAATLGLALALVALAWRRRHAPLLLAAGLVAGTLLVLAPWLPFPLGFEELAAPLADRYLYAAAAAPAIVAGVLLGPHLARGRRALLAAGMAALALGPLCAARAQAQWSSDEAFARAALEAAPGSANLWAKLGEGHVLRLQETGRPDAGQAALAALDRALALDPGHRVAGLNRFIVLALTGQEAGATAAAGDLLARWPDDPLVLDNVAEWHAGQGRYDVALALYERELATGRALPRAAAAAQACREALAAPDAR